MYIPLDHLYHWVYNLSGRPVIIYYFFPYGSKNLTDICHYPSANNLDQNRALRDRINVICHDQEPLNFELYQNTNIDVILETMGVLPNSSVADCFDRSITNLELGCYLRNCTIYDTPVLIHSELYSKDVAQYQCAGYQTVYYWCHAVIARDWYRFANIDHRLNTTQIPSKDFLIYARDWSGSREYRLKFLHLFDKTQLHSHSLCYFNPISSSSGHHYHQHNFANKKFDIEGIDLNNNYVLSTVDATASADYNVQDFENTKISIVLETQFDASKIHLTEKICRPIACGHPFVVAAGPGTLKLLRRYGFETFDPWIDESYDNETDSVLRLEKIIMAMKKFNLLPVEQKHDYYAKIKKIAEHNRKHFFSTDFGSHIENELLTNLQFALSQAEFTKGKKYLRLRKKSRQIFGREFVTNPHAFHQLKLLRQLRQQQI